MAGNRGRRSASGKKRYYKPPSALDKVRHRLADGTPTHELLHYLHGRSKLPADVRVIAEAAEKLYQARELLTEVHGDDGITEVAKILKCRFPKLRALTRGEAAKLIKKFMIGARKALIIKTMKEPEEG